MNSLRIDIFKNNIFNDLVQYNSTIIQITKKETFDSEKISNWFNPKYCNLIPLARSYPEVEEFQLSPNWNLVMTLPNYVSLFVISKLYKDNTGILIEDACSGMGVLPFYLSKLGFGNFHIIENFSQIESSFLTKLLNTTGSTYQVNVIDTKPTVVNLACFPMYPKKLDGAGNPFFAFTRYIEFVDNQERIPTCIEDSIELFIMYKNQLYLKNELLRKDFVYLGTDTNAMMFIYCRKNKYDQFYNTLKEYDCPTSSEAWPKK